MISKSKFAEYDPNAPASLASVLQYQRPLFSQLNSWRTIENISYNFYCYLNSILSIFTLPMHPHTEPPVRIEYILKMPAGLLGLRKFDWTGQFFFKFWYIFKKNNTQYLHLTTFSVPELHASATDTWTIKIKTLGASRIIQSEAYVTTLSSGPIRPKDDHCF